MSKLGRKKGSVIRLFDDPGRFEIAAWLAFRELGMTPYKAAYLATFLFSGRAITTESIDGVLLTSSTIHRTTVAGHADRIRRKAPEALKRANERERTWLIRSSGLILGLVKFMAESNKKGLSVTLDLLTEAGWADTILAISRRIDESLRTNFPPANSNLSRTAARFLSEMRQRAE